ncbi:regulator of ribonuclease activity B [Prosthecobacter fusiformis]|uniref:Regulator of ribonuclease activity B n=1 Tax=Prosthecobacter fusiformis TaxID=48464 RepID=A0A4R7RMN2_9BACT|nr:ribonuclease E inhibitor RraB [Prosthecobacter fusiformis]TDU66048.1 regulator of ribonuclease activity B [Prosthecobacter fusiformis]
MSDPKPRQPKTITLEMLQKMFVNISEKTDWDMTSEMLWGYFFTHHEPGALEVARDLLVEQGYRFVNIYQLEEEDPNAPRPWWLHLEKEETHTPASLDVRNDELYQFAYDQGLDSYDGMDIGPIETEGE